MEEGTDVRLSRPQPNFVPEYTRICSIKLKMQKVCGIVTLLQCLAIFTLQAQKSFHLSGLILNAAGSGLPKATIAIISKKDTFYTLSRDDGKFDVDLVSRKFKLEISMSGYSSYKGNFSIAD